MSTQKRTLSLRGELTLRDEAFMAAMQPGQPIPEAFNQLDRLVGAISRLVAEYVPGDYGDLYAGLRRLETLAHVHYGDPVAEALPDEMWRVFSFLELSLSAHEALLQLCGVAEPSN